MPPFPETSDTPLTEDILGDKPKFIPTFLEHITRVGERIIRSKVATSGSILFVVPEKHVLFLQTLTLSGHNRSTSFDKIVTIFVGQSANNDTLLSLWLSKEHAAGQTDPMDSTSISFPYLLMIEEGKKVQVTAEDGDLDVISGLTGFLVDKKILF